MNGLPVALGLLLLATPDAQDLGHLHRTLSLTFELAGAQTPQRDFALELASQKLAQETLLRGIEEASAFSNVLQLTSLTGAMDAMPRAYFFLGDCVEGLLQTAQQRLGHLNVQHTTTHMGVGLASLGKQHALCILLTERKGKLSMPKMDGDKASRKKKVPICVELYGSRTKPRLVVLNPQNQIQETAMQTHHHQWCAKLAFPHIGRYTVEVVAQTERGPQVTHLFFVHIGEKPPPPRTSASGELKKKNTTPDASSFEEKHQQIYDAINQLRRASALAKLHPKKELEKLAQQYARQMETEAFFSHVDAQGRGLRERLHQAQIVCQEAGENLSIGDSPLMAHHVIEQSPAHRAALLNKGFQHMGVGFISGMDGKFYLVEVFCN